MKVLRKYFKTFLPLVAPLWFAATINPAKAATVEYVHTDALGSPVAVTNESAEIIERAEYEPFGTTIGKSNEDRPGFTGHVMDSATMLICMQQRYYDPSIGRFLSVDPVAAREGGDNFNRYSYANDNPFKFTDPDGREAGAAYRSIYKADGGRVEEPAEPPSPIAELIGDVLVSAIADVLLGGPSGEGAAIFTGIRTARLADKTSDVRRGVSAANRAESKARGVPDSQIGPSGKPKVHTVEHSTRKSARDAAQRETPSGGRVRNDASPKDGQKPHFQAEDARGNNVKPVVHHCKPNKAC